MIKRNESKLKRQLAQMMAELPLVLWLIFLVLTIPLVDFVCFSLRYNCLLIVSREAAQSASRAKTFQTNVSASELSAVNSASSTASSVAAAFPEVSVNSVNTYIVASNISSGVCTRQNTKLAAPANTSEYTYQIETLLNGQTNPILRVGQGHWGQIPGLTAPIQVSVASRAYAECPQGLNQ